MLQPIIVFGVVAFYLTTGLKNCITGNIWGINGNWLSSLGDYGFYGAFWQVYYIYLFLFKLCISCILRIIGLIIGFSFVILFPNMTLNIYVSVFCYRIFIA